MSMAPSDTGRPSREETQQRLLDGAYEAFCAVGFQAATIEDICHRAGFTRGAFYSNFTGKDELLLALWHRTIARTTRAIDRILAATDGSVTPVDDLIEGLIVLRAADREWFILSTEFLLHSLREEGLQVKVAAARERFGRALTRAVGRVLTAEGRRPPDGLDVAGFTRLLIAGHVGCQHVSATDDLGVQVTRDMARTLLSACPRVEDGDATVDLTG